MTACSVLKSAVTPGPWATAIIVAGGRFLQCAHDHPETGQRSRHLQSRNSQAVELPVNREL